MSPSTSVSEAPQDQQNIEEAFIALYMAARTDGALPTLADGLQCIANAERKVAERQATAARVAASKGTKRVHLIEEAQSDDEHRATKIRSRKFTGERTKGLSPATMYAKDGTSGLDVAACKSTHGGVQEPVPEHGASAKAIMESSEPFTAISERIPEAIQRLSLDQGTLKGRVPRRSKEQRDALVEEALALLD